jgi:alkanesulfonate monooxygenase SsuD/methylene tetrahydromethanopterin reductase-like flavin-dependent oxidoreductase (luciferase family)
MKFALFLLASWTETDTAHQSRIYAEALEQARYAEELGFDSVWIAEHHSSRYGIFPSLMPILSHIAAQTKTIRLGAGVSVLPFHHPIRLAEEAAMVDVLSHGRLNFGVGRGSADYEYGNFGSVANFAQGALKGELSLIGEATTPPICRIARPP